MEADFDGGTPTNDTPSGKSSRGGFIIPPLLKKKKKNRSSFVGDASDGVETTTYPTTTAATTTSSIATTTTTTTTPTASVATAATGCGDGSNDAVVDANGKTTLRRAFSCETEISSFSGATQRMGNRKKSNPLPPPSSSSSRVLLSKGQECSGGGVGAEEVNNSSSSTLEHPPGTRRIGGLGADYHVLDKSINNGKNSVPRESPYISQLPGGGLQQQEWGVAKDARPILPKIAFFMGDLRDGLPMLNMQTTFLMTAKFYTEKQIGALFFAFSISQFIVMPLSGYLLDYTNNKIQWVQWASVATSFLTVLTAMFSMEYGENLPLMVLIKVVQGCTSTLLPLGLHSLTLGIVGSTGMTQQVARNKVMNHLGTALIVAIGTITVFISYPHTHGLGFLFVVSPLWCMATLYYLWRIKPSQVNRDAARALIIESPTMTEYEELDAEEKEKDKQQGKSDNTEDSSEDDDEDEDVILNEFGQCGDTGCLDGTSSSQVIAHIENTFHNRSGGAAEYGATEGSSQFHYVPPSLPPTPEESETSHDENPPLPNQTLSSSPSSGGPLVKNPDDHQLAITKGGRRGSGEDFLTRGPSFIFGFGESACSSTKSIMGDGGRLRPRAQTPLWVFSHPTLLLFTAIVFLFHLGNSSILPLVMQTLSVQDARRGVLMSGLCIFIAQGFMSVFAQICGDYSPIWGRKKLFLFGLFSLPVRCFFLFYLCQLLPGVQNESELLVVHGLILATQFLDAIGAGIFGTLYILVTNDLAAETGRFNLMIGMTSGAMCLGGTVSGYVGQSLAQDIGYHAAFGSLGGISLIPAFMYLFCMPETLPDYAKLRKRNKKAKKRRFGNFFLQRKKTTENTQQEQPQSTEVDCETQGKTNESSGGDSAVGTHKWVELL